MIERWMRDSITAFKSSLEKIERGKEGDFKQALLLADHATETLMRNYLIFKKEEADPPYDYPSLLEKVAKITDLPSECIETITTFRLIRDGFHHHNIEKIRKGLKGTTTGLTLEKSYLEDYLKAVSKLFSKIANIEISLGGK